MTGETIAPLLHWHIAPFWLSGSSKIRQGGEVSIGVEVMVLIEEESVEVPVGKAPRDISARLLSSTELEVIIELPTKIIVVIPFCQFLVGCWRPYSVNNGFRVHLLENSNTCNPTFLGGSLTIVACEWAVLYDTYTIQLCRRCGIFNVTKISEDSEGFGPVKIPLKRGS